MPQTTRCPGCGVVLNLPEGAIGRRLKCPKCGNKFQSGTPESTPSMLAPGDTPTAPGGTRATADVASLFREDDSAPRHTTAADRRAQSRPCPSCQRMVPAGMSLCPNCGLDLDSGTRVDLDDDLDVVE